MLIDVRSRRKKANISQAELAALVGVSQPTISNYERGLLISPEHYDAILEAFAKLESGDEEPIKERDDRYEENLRSVGSPDKIG